MIRFSIVTPSYQQGRYIERTIQSVQRQEWPGTQHIVIDGGSTDQTVSILHRYRDVLAYWVSEPDGGQSNAINKGAAHATGDVIGWLNSDDVYLPGAFRAVSDYLDDHSDVDACYGGLVVIDEDDLVVNATWPPRADVRFAVGVTLNVNQQTLFVRRHVWDQLEGVDERLHYVMDYDLVVRLLLRYRVGRIQRFLGAYRRQPEAKTSLLSGGCSDELRLIRERYQTRALGRDLGRAGVAAVRGRHLVNQAKDGGVRYVAFKLALRTGVRLPSLVGLPARLPRGPVRA